MCGKEHLQTRVSDIEDAFSSHHSTGCVDCAVQACATASENKPDFCSMRRLSEADIEECVDCTDLNVVFGLYVGHDTLFYQHSDAPRTTMVVKDRALANNPVSAPHVARCLHRITGC